MSLPVDKLSDLAWARVERGIWARIDEPVAAPARRRWWPWLAVPVLALLAFALWPRGAAVVVEPPAQVARFVSQDAPSAMSFDDIHVELAAHSAIVRTGPVLLERGSAWFTVAPRNGRPPFEVLAGDATVRVIGTRFRVARDGDRVDVDVEHGIVEVIYRGTSTRVGAGGHWTSEPPPAPPPAPVPAPAPAPPPTPAPPTRVDPTALPFGSAAAAGKAAGVDDRATFEKLAALERRDPDAAIAGYLALARGTGAWAEVALFAAARLAADRGDARAHELLTSYLHRFPHGANRADAERLLGAHR